MKNLDQKLNGPHGEGEGRCGLGIGGGQSGVFDFQKLQNQPNGRQVGVAVGEGTTDGKALGIRDDCGDGLTTETNGLGATIEGVTIGEYGGSTIGLAVVGGV